VVSTDDGEYSPTFDPKRGELYFMRRTPGRFDYTIMVSQRNGTEWTEPVVAAFSGEHRDASPSLSPAGDALVFDSRRPNTPLEEGSIDLWRVDRVGAGWTEPRLLADASRNIPDETRDGRDEFGPLLTRDGDLYFYSFRTPDRGGRHYRVRADSPGLVEHADKLPDPSADTFVGYMTLAADGRLAVFEGRQRGGGGTDLFAARRDAQGDWSRAYPLDRINTPANEGTPYLTPDGELLLFASDRPTESRLAETSNLFSIATEAALSGLPIATDDALPKGVPSEAWKQSDPNQQASGPVGPLANRGDRI
jgi:Tol biopolymer transport system component